VDKAAMVWKKPLQEKKFKKEAIAQAKKLITKLLL
jgi:hypothetical protein